MPGRASGAVLDEAYGESRGRDDDCVGAIESRDSEMRGGWRNGANAERGTGAAGGVWLFSSLGVGRVGIGQGVGRLACVLATVMGVWIGHLLVGLRNQIIRTLAGLLVNRPARHTASRNRMERKHG